jgi:inorganic triphosphatase YgiF
MKEGSLVASEIELKLDVSLSQLNRLQRTPWLKRYASGPAQDHRLDSVYYDTDDLKLRRRQAILRVRESDGRFTQTFKAQSQASDAALGRLEWECPIAHPQPDLKDARKKKTGGVNLRKLAGSLKPVFETSVHRHTLPLQYRGSQLELALDRGEIKTGRRRAPIHEVEVELKDGNPATVIVLGREIAKKLDVAYGVASKAERGYALREEGADAPVRAQPIALAAEMVAAKAFQAIAMSCVHHFAGNQSAVLHGKAEGVHQMRIGLRRLRAAISVFKGILRGPETEAVKDSLKWLTEELGPARDMDVLADEGITALAEKTAVHHAAAMLKRDVLSKREKGLEQAQHAVASDRYRHLVLDTVLWINGGRWTRSQVRLMKARRRLPIPRYAAQELRRRTHKVLKKLAKIDDLRPLERHKLRIAVKKLRYATGYFASLFGGETAVKKFTAALKDLQSSLGQLNDIRVHGQLAKVYAAPAHGTRRAAAQAFAMGELSGDERAKSRKLLKATKRRGKRLERCPQFWQ